MQEQEHTGMDLFIKWRALCESTCLLWRI